MKATKTPIDGDTEVHEKRQEEKIDAGAEVEEVDHGQKAKEEALKIGDD